MGKMDISYILDPRHEKLFTIVSMLQFRVSQKLWTLYYPGVLLRM